jgi:hypothetical protein
VSINNRNCVAAAQVIGSGKTLPGLPVALLVCDNHVRSGAVPEAITVLWCPA